MIKTKKKIRKNVINISDINNDKKRKSIGRHKVKNNKKYWDSQENYSVELNEDILELECFGNLEYFVPFTTDLESYYLSFRNNKDEHIDEKILKELIDCANNRNVKKHFDLMDIIYKEYNSGNEHIFIKNIDGKLYNKVKIEMYDENKYSNTYLKVGNKFGFPKLGPGGTIDKYDINKNIEEIENNIYEVKDEKDFNRITFNTAMRELEEETGLKYLGDNIFSINDHCGNCYNFQSLGYDSYEKKRESGFMNIIKIYFPKNSVLEMKRIFINKKRFETDTHIEVTSFL